MSAPTVFDSAPLEKLIGMVGEATVREIVELFREHGPLRLEAARSGRRDGDAAAARLALHSLRSSAQMVGCIEVHELAGEGEKLAAEGDLESLEAPLDRLGGALDRALAALVESFPAAGSGT